MPSFIYIVVIPVVLSPFKTAHWIGAAPLYLGSNEPWTFIQPNLGISNISFGKVYNTYDWSLLVFMHFSNTYWLYSSLYSILA